MPHALRVYQELSNTSLAGPKSLAIANAVASARGALGNYEEAVTVDLLCDAGCAEEIAEMVARALACCFPSERCKRSFKRSKLKFDMVRAGLPAACADTLLAALEPCVVTGRDDEVRAMIQYVPAPGRVVMCDFTFLRKPEMQKERRAIVVSKRFEAVRGRCKVVPVSKAQSNAGHPLHHEFLPGSYPFFHANEPVWAVCDHVYTVGLGRLWQVNIAHKPYISGISEADLAAIRVLLGTSLGV